MDIYNTLLAERFDPRRIADTSRTPTSDKDDEEERPSGPAREATEHLDPAQRRPRSTAVVPLSGTVWGPPLGPPLGTGRRCPGRRWGPGRRCRWRRWGPETASVPRGTSHGCGLNEGDRPAVFVVYLVPPRK